LCVVPVAWGRGRAERGIIRARCALLERTARKLGLNVLNLVVACILLRIETLLFPFRFVVVAVRSLVIYAMASGVIMGVRETTFPSLSKTLFHDALEYFHFSGNFLYFPPEEINFVDLPPKCILVRFSERTQFIQQ
jgi:hypothetical protein